MTHNAELWSADREERDLLVRGVDNVLTQRWSRNGSVGTPSSVTVTVKDAVGTRIVDEQAATVTNDVASYTVPAAATTDLPLSEGWTVVWSAIMQGESQAREFVGEAALVRYVLSPPATLEHLYRRVARLNPNHRSPMTVDVDLQGMLDDAWRDIEDMLFERGRRPELVLSPARFRQPHLLLALALIFENLALSSEAYAAPAERYRAQFGKAWDGMRFTYDTDERGLPDGGATPRREAPDSTVWLSSRGDVGTTDGY